MSNSESAKERKQATEDGKQAGDSSGRRASRTYKRGNDYSAVSPAVIKRLPRYFRYLRELLRHDILRISSSELSEMMNVTASQIRQDLNCFGGFGQQGYGYNVKYLYGKISDILGVSSGFNAVIIGAGNLGHAIAGSNMFEHRNMKLIGIFDVAPAIIGQKIADYTVMDMAQLPAFAEAHPIDIAILTVPKEYAQETAQTLANIGIRGLWNFTSTELDLKVHGIMVENVHMGDSLMRLMYEINNNEQLNET
ncbi:MAG: redox-sensing transcriptional repressor Rex [Ruminococcaceae bacterium]|nr:redox-sensing transcriptional repressor Rex [Oscillospiraceae bacterium]